jgi:dUTP pyrophosphatase
MNKIETIKVTAPRPDLVPTRGSEHAAGYDLYADESGEIEPGKRLMVSTGICMQIPTGYYGKIECRSGLALKYGLITLGTIVDEDYRGVIRVILYNSGTEKYTFNMGDRIAQMIILKHHADTPLERVDKLDDTVRNFGGFGASGV